MRLKHGDAVALNCCTASNTYTINCFFRPQQCKCNRNYLFPGHKSVNVIMSFVQTQTQTLTSTSTSTHICVYYCTHLAQTHHTHTHHHNTKHRHTTCTPAPLQTPQPHTTTRHTPRQTDRHTQTDRQKDRQWDHFCFNTVTRCQKPSAIYRESS